MIESDFTGFILSGGKSSRMGRDKAFLKIGGKTFLENAFEILKPNCEQVKIALNVSQTHFIEKLPAGISYIFDIFEGRGALGGIHAALKDCETEFAVILAVDLPFVTSHAIEKLCEIANNSKKVSAIVPRQNDEKWQPLCAVYRVKDCLPKAEELLSKNESVSVRDFLSVLELKIIESKSLSHRENLLKNINSPVDFLSIK